jgi:hypothetical protein
MWTHTTPGKGVVGKTLKATTFEARGKGDSPPRTLVHWPTKSLPPQPPSQPPPYTDRLLSRQRIDKEKAMTGQLINPSVTRIENNSQVMETTEAALVRMTTKTLATRECKRKFSRGKLRLLNKLYYY